MSTRVSVGEDRRDGDEVVALVANPVERVDRGAETVLGGGRLIPRAFAAARERPITHLRRLRAGCAKSLK